jgi:hypothetical protein
MARTLGTEGLRLAEAGNCAAAVDKLSRAERLHHAPTTLTRLGECQVSLGHYVEGTENLRHVVKEHIEPSAPAAFLAAQQRAQKSLDAALPHIGKLRIDVAGPAAGDVALRVDGQSVSSASIGMERPVDPGAHTVEATAPGYKAGSGRIEVADGGSQTVSLTLERDVTATTQTTHIVEQSGPKTTTTTHRVYWPAAVAFGVAGAGVALTAIFGSIAAVKKSDLVTACGGGTSCPPSEQGAFNDVSTFASVANVGLIVGGVAAAVGIVLLVAAPRRTETVVVSASPFGASLSGTFF